MGFGVWGLGLQELAFKAECFSAQAAAFDLGEEEGER